MYLISFCGTSTNEKVVSIANIKILRWKREWRTGHENAVWSCVNFSLQPLKPMKRCEKCNVLKLHASSCLTNWVYFLGDAHRSVCVNAQAKIQWTLSLNTDQKKRETLDPIYILRGVSSFDTCREKGFCVDCMCVWKAPLFVYWWEIMCSDHFFLPIKRKL